MAYMDRNVRLRYVRRVFICIGINSNCSEAERFRGSDDPAGDFPAIGDKK